MWGSWCLARFWRALSSSHCKAAFSGIPYLTGAFVSGPPVGIGILSAGIILAIMIIPFIASVMRDVFEVTPALLKESAYGLGATTWEVVWKVVLPFTKTGVLGGIMLGLGRALGETMAVTFVIGNMNQLDSLSVFEAANSITSALANEFAGWRGPPPSLAHLSGSGSFLHHLCGAVFESKLLLSQLKKGEGRAREYFSTPDFCGRTVANALGSLTTAASVSTRSP